MVSHKGFHGSPKESHTTGSGNGKSREVTVGSTPGKAAMRVKPQLAKAAFESRDKKVPKTGKPYTEE